MPDDIVNTVWLSSIRANIVTTVARVNRPRSILSMRNLIGYPVRCRGRALEIELEALYPCGVAEFPEQLFID